LLAKLAKETTGDTLIAEKIMGASLAGQGRFDEAIAYYQRAAEASPNELQPMFSLVRAQLKAGKSKEAEAFANSLITANPDNPQAYILHGAVQLALSRVPEAKASYEKAVEKGPNNPQSYLALAEFYQKQKDDAKAIEVLAAGIGKATERNDMRMAMAAILERNGRNDEAIGLYEEIVKETPNATIAVNNLVSLLTDNRDDPATLARAAEMASVLKDSPIPYFRETLGWALVRQGNVKAGLPILEQTITKLENNSAAHYHLGMAYAADGSKALASKYLKKALELEKINPNKERIIRALEILGD
jgi:cellulose synthase operon protein C